MHSACAPRGVNNILSAKDYLEEDAGHENINRIQLFSRKKYFHFKYQKFLENKIVFISITHKLTITF